MTRISTLVISGLCLAALLYFAASTPGPLTAPLAAFSPILLPPYIASGFCLLALAYRPLAALSYLGAALCGGAGALWLLEDPALAGNAGPGFWSLCLATGIATAGAMIGLTGMPLTGRLAMARDITVPALFGIVLIAGAEVVIRGAGVPSVLLPAPSAVARRFVTVMPMLMEDFAQTFIKGVLTGYVIGNGLGFLTAAAIQRSPFFGRGLLPLGNFVSSLPIVGVAPIMVMWFGFDWPSKAAVVAIITFFPMLTNAAAGLSAVERIDLDLMHSYGATFPQQFSKLRLPSSLPFVFNALKINSTLALIGAIVAEFFGTPTKGMGFRISIEAARMSMDVVWAEILLAALVGTAFYGCLVALERSLTFWHASQRA